MLTRPKGLLAAVRAGRRAAERPDGGFTLIELIISVAILGIIMSAVTSAIYVSLSQLSTSQTRLWESNDVRLVASRFSTDVSGGNTFETSATTSSASACGGVAAASTVLEITGSRFDPDVPPSTPATALTTTITTYVTVAGADPATLELRRLVCSSGPAGTATTTQVLARGLADGSVGGRPKPTAVCTNAGGSTVACDATTAAVVRLTLTPASGDTQLTTTLLGRRRTT